MKFILENILSDDSKGMDTFFLHDYFLLAV